MLKITLYTRLCSEAQLLKPHNSQQTDNGLQLYRSIASKKFLSLADAVSTAIRRYRSVAFSLGILETTAAGSRAGTHGTPVAPTTVHRGRSSAHVHALLVDAPLRGFACTHSILFFVPRVRRMQYVTRGLLPVSYFARNTNFQRAQSSLDTSIYFSGAIKSTSAGRASAPKATKSTARSDTREAGARCLINLTLRESEREREGNQTLFCSANVFPTTTTRDEWTDERRRIANGFRREAPFAFAIRRDVCSIIDATSEQHIICILDNTGGCINNDAKRPLNNPRWEYILPGEQVLRNLRVPCFRRISFRPPSVLPSSSSSSWSSTTAVRNRSPEIYTVDLEEL